MIRVVMGVMNVIIITSVMGEGAIMANDEDDKIEDNPRWDRSSDKKHPDKTKHDDDDKSNTTDQVKQGRWRTVTTEQVPQGQIQQPTTEDYVEHRPLGY
jgi:hypothetical protein